LTACYLVSLDNMQFFSGAVELFYGQKWLSPPVPLRKNGPYAS